MALLLRSCHVSPRDIDRLAQNATYQASMMCGKQTNNNFVRVRVRGSYLPVVHKQLLLRLLLWRGECARHGYCTTAIAQQQCNGKGMLHYTCHTNGSGIPARAFALAHTSVASNVAVLRYCCVCVYQLCHTYWYEGLCGTRTRTACLLSCCVEWSHITAVFAFHRESVCPHTIVTNRGKTTTSPALRTKNRNGK